MLAGQVVRSRPVGRRPPTVELPDRRQQERSAAHPDDTARPRREIRQPVDEVMVRGRGMDTGAAWHDQCVDLLEAAEVVGDHGQPALRTQRAGLRGDDGDVIARVGDRGGGEHPRRTGEDLVRSGDVDRLHAWEGDDRNASGRRPMARHVVECGSTACLASMTSYPRIPPSTRGGCEPLPCPRGRSHRHHAGPS